MAQGEAALCTLMLVPCCMLHDQAKDGCHGALRLCNRDFVEYMLVSISRYPLLHARCCLPGKKKSTASRPCAFRTRMPSGSRPVMKFKLKCSIQHSRSDKNILACTSPANCMQFKDSCGVRELESVRRIDADSEPEIILWKLCTRHSNADPAPCCTVSRDVHESALHVCKLTHLQSGTSQRDA